MSRILTSVVVLLALSGCAKRVRIVKTPYQTALETYYGELDKSGPDGPLEKSSAAAKAAITANPASLETRLLHLNILLQQAFLNPPVPNAPAQFVAEFKRLHLRPPGLLAQDWAVPRIYITFGDYLLRLATQANAEEGPAAAHTAKAAYQSASDFYSLAHRLATAAKEAAQERDNALDGYVQAQRGIFEAIMGLEDGNSPRASELVRALSEPTLARVSAALEKGEVTPAPFSVALLSPGALMAQDRHHQDLANRKLEDVETWCGANKALLAAADSALTAAQREEVQKGVTRLREAVQLRETQLARAYLNQQLFQAGETAGAVRNLGTLYQGIKVVCR